MSAEERLECRCAPHRDPPPAAAFIAIAIAPIEPSSGSATDRAPRAAAALRTAAAPSAPAASAPSARPRCAAPPARATRTLPPHPAQPRVATGAARILNTACAAGAGGRRRRHRVRAAEEPGAHRLHRRRGGAPRRLAPRRTAPSPALTALPRRQIDLDTIEVSNLNRQVRARLLRRRLPPQQRRADAPRDRSSSSARATSASPRPRCV
eukprot:COSAG04_NODE_22_length_37957_cov_250.276930_19_plen_209_part_00